MTFNLTDRNRTDFIMEAIVDEYIMENGTASEKLKVAEKRYLKNKNTDADNDDTDIDGGIADMMQMYFGIVEVETAKYLLA